MKKMNKKGFTLIEMLVVIAIIAILVSIIIPAVSSSTTRAAAATDAANLRSAKAVISIGLLDGTFKKGESPSAEACGVPEEGKLGGTFSASIDSTTGEVTVQYGGQGIEDLAQIAGGEKEYVKDENQQPGGNGGSGGSGGNGGNETDPSTEPSTEPHQHTSLKNKGNVHGCENCNDIDAEHTYSNTKINNKHYCECGASENHDGYRYSSTNKKKCSVCNQY